jgi:hypothetical protein
MAFRKTPRKVQLLAVIATEKKSAKNAENALKIPAICFKNIAQ